MLASDLRFAIRSLRQAPGFSALAVLVLAVGIGTTSATFNLIDGTLIRPLPYADPDRLVMLWEHPPSYARNRVSPLNFLDWSDQTKALNFFRRADAALAALPGVQSVGFVENCHSTAGTSVSRSRSLATRRSTRRTASPRTTR